MIYDLYCRLSVAPDGSRETVDRQERLMREELAKDGSSVRNVYVDNSLSASDPKVVRKDFERLFQRIEAGDSTPVMVWHMDRYIRQPYDLERLVRAAEHGLIIRSLYGSLDLRNPDQLSVARILCTMAAKESAMTSRRVKAKAQERAEQGKPNSRSYGLLPGGIIVPAEAKVLVEAAERTVARERWRSIVLDFTARGIRALPKEKVIDGRRVVVAPGLPFTHDTLRKTLSRPILGGIVELNGVALGLLPEAILSPELYTQLQARLAATRRGRPPSPKYLLSGRITCGDCGRLQRGCLMKHNTMMPDGNPRRIYRCSPNEHERRCARVITADFVEAVVGEHIKAALANPAYRARLSLGQAGVSAELEALHTEAAQLGGALADLTTDYGFGAIPEARYRRSRMRITTRLADIQGQLRDADDPVQMAAALTAVANDDWDSATPEERRRLVEATVARVVVAPGTGGKFDPSRVTVEMVFMDQSVPETEEVSA